MDKGWMEAAFRRWRETGQAEELGELLKAYRDRAYSVALRLMGSGPDAEDVVQQASIKLLTRTAGLEDLAALERSIFRAVVQCALDALRARKRRNRREMAGLDESMGAPMSAQDDPGGTNERQETLAQLRQAVLELPEEERAPVVLCYYQGLTEHAAAETLEVPRSTMRFRLAKGLERLRKMVDGRGKNFEGSALLALLWNDGAATAPESLCRALDAALPGRPCGQLPPLARPATPPAPTGLEVLPVAKPVALAAGASLAAVAVLGVVCGLAYFKPGAPPAPARSVPVAQNPISKPVPVAPARETGTKADAVAPVKAAANALGTGEKPQEEEHMSGRMIGALALAGALLAPVAGQAGEPNAEAAKAIAQIQARRAEKDEAAAKASNARAQGENGGRAGQSGTTNPVGAPGGSWGR